MIGLALHTGLGPLFCAFTPSSYHLSLSAMSLCKHRAQILQAWVNNVNELHLQDWDLTTRANKVVSNDCYLGLLSNEIRQLLTWIDAGVYSVITTRWQQSILSNIYTEKPQSHNSETKTLPTHNHPDTLMACICFQILLMSDSTGNRLQTILCWSLLSGISMIAERVDSSTWALAQTPHGSNK